ncbi:MAG: hypothetical protein LBS40_09200 [Burkholderiales bacterium]|jgi:hypothetical protein|nr:hypothetical protein [Burkholderiales bacterium]
MSTLQLTLLALGIILILGVIVYNVIQERVIRRSFADRAAAQRRAEAIAAKTSPEKREEPILVSKPKTIVAPSDAPDFMAEAILTLQLPETVQITPELARQILRIPGKSVRLLWQPYGATQWTLFDSIPTILAYFNQIRITSAPLPLSEKTVTEDEENAATPPASAHMLACCLQLADRSHVTTTEQLEIFQKHVEGIASLLSASYTPFDTAVEAERAQALDKMCAQLDLQIGLTLHGRVGPIPGQQLLLTAQKQGFILQKGALRYQRNGHELFRIESNDGKPLSEERLHKAIQDSVALLDVPQVPDPDLVFDEMLKQISRLAQTLSAELVDDRRKPLNDQGMSVIRAEVEKATQALRNAGIEPGSSRALRLFAS